MSTPPRLEIEQLRVLYPRADGGELVAVDDVDLRVDAGEAVGLFGDSGCGKSSLALGAFGLAGSGARVTGTVRLDGERLDGRALVRARGRRVGLVFQQPSLALHPLRSIGGQLADVLRAHTELDRRGRRGRSRQLMTELGLEADHLAARPHQLSGGQAQRALLAIALAAEPVLLVADEPTAALDAETESAVLDLVDRLRRQRGLSLLWISHDPRVLGRLCDRIAVLRGGRIVEESPAERILVDPAVPGARTSRD